MSGTAKGGEVNGEARTEDRETVLGIAITHRSGQLISSVDLSMAPTALPRAGPSPWPER